MEPMKLYEKWMKAYADYPETMADLKAIMNDPKEIEDRFYRDLEFGTAGMRGVLGAGTNRLNIFNVRRVTRALAKYILTKPGGAEQGVAIAYDSRNKSTEFAKETALVLANSGVKAYLFESLRPVPVLSCTVRHLKCIAGVVITASHNPSQYNGYKVYWTDGGQMPPESVKGITDLLPEVTDEESMPMDEKTAIEKGLLTYIGKDVDDAYIAAIKKLSVNPELAKEMGKTLKIVYTPLHGSGNIPVRRIFKEIGMENVYVVPEQELPDGNFPTVPVPNPEDPRAFALALKMQQELGADLCVGTDPDCDRVGIACMTENGPKLLNGNQIGCILLHYILSQKKERGELPANAAAVTTIVSTEMARAICDDYGVKLIKVLTGFKYIAEQIHIFETTGCNTFMFGFEESYGFLSGTDVRDKDGVNACMLIAEAASWYVRAVRLLRRQGDLLRAARQGRPGEDAAHHGRPAGESAQGLRGREGRGRARLPDLHPQDRHRRNRDPDPAQEQRALLRAGEQGLDLRAPLRHRAEDQAVRQRRLRRLRQDPIAAQRLFRRGSEAAGEPVSIIKSRRRY